MKARRRTPPRAIRGPRRVTLATDLSPEADRAFERATRIAETYGSELSLLYVLDAAFPERVARTLAAQARTHLEELMDGMPAAIRRRTTCRMPHGDPTVEILRHCDAIGAELLVMGMHRKSGVQELFVGTTVERVIRAGDTPVLMVRDRGRRPYARALVAADLSPCSREAFRAAARLFPDTAFTAVHVYDVPFSGFIRGSRARDEVRREHTERFDGFIADALAGLPKQPKVRTMLLPGGVVERLGAAVRRIKPGLLVLGTHGRSALSDAVLGTTAGTFLKSPPCDVLVVRHAPSE